MSVMRSWAPGVRAFLAGDDPHAFRPAAQVEQAGEPGDPGAVADLPVAVVGRGPGASGDLGDGVGDLVGDGEPDGILQPAAGPGEPGEEVVAAAGGVGADQHSPKRVLRKLGPRELDRLEQRRLGTQHRGISQAVTAQRHRHRQVGHDLARVMH